MIKFIIAQKDGKLRHYKSDWLSHDTIARDNGIDALRVIERGLIVDNKPLILECNIDKHKQKHHYDKLCFDPSILRAREVETMYIYKYCGQKEGD